MATTTNPRADETMADQPGMSARTRETYDSPKLDRPVAVPADDVTNHNTTASTSEPSAETLLGAVRAWARDNLADATVDASRCDSGIDVVVRVNRGNLTPSAIRRMPGRKHGHRFRSDCTTIDIWGER